MYMCLFARVNKTDVWTPQWITPNAERARLRADWNEDKTQIIQRTYGEKFPKITQRYLDGDYMVEIARCQGHNGKPMDGHVKHVYRRCC
eukprot:1374872-Amorphochlora_amoeboformis.AAC.3